MSETKKIGILLLNLGTPDEPTPTAVGRYLKEFLSDPYVIDIPAPLRWFLVNVLIVPRRKHASSEAYQKVWTDRGSPLKFHLIDLHAGVRDALGNEFVVEKAMRYQNPSMETAVESLRAKGVTEIRLISLYPQYSQATNLSTEEHLKKILGEKNWSVPVRVLPPFYRDPGFIEAFRERIQNVLDLGPFDRLILSYHGLPERQVKKADSTGCYCLQEKDCCGRINEKNQDFCYSAHCHETTRQLTRALKLSPSQVMTSFQSRLGRTKWLDPDTVKVVSELRKEGVERIVVACPAFTADCLETLEEIGLRLRTQFMDEGGKDFRWVPSLNSEATWVNTVARYARESSRY
jgi:protoporphyrin/coproporphyrin ferrochelatase